MRLSESTLSEKDAHWVQLLHQKEHRRNSGYCF